MQREPASHRIADEVGALDAEVVPENLEVSETRVHGAHCPGLQPSFAMTAQVGHDPAPASGHGVDQLLPAPPALRKAVEEGDRGALACNEIVEAHVGALQNRHGQIVWM